MKIICRPAALSALMRCHLASLIICQAMLITYNCPQAGGAFSFPPDGDLLEKRTHNICHSSFQAIKRQDYFQCIYAAFSFYS